MAESPPLKPAKSPPPQTWEHYDLYLAVRSALYALPSRFSTDLTISGVLATDLFTFNSSLGASIEEQMVEALNGADLRVTWDPKGKYALYRFVRQSQTFPDVTLRTSAPGTFPEVLLGIELKGWYVLAKEREPSFRYKVTPGACAPQDLIAVFPWALQNVVSGSPQLFDPFVELAGYAAAYRNWHWEYAKGGTGDNRITISEVKVPYPKKKSEEISDRPVSDSGNNFGRIARTGMMTEYSQELFQKRLSGIPLSAWQKFLAIFSEDKSADVIGSELERVFRDASPPGRITEEALEGIRVRFAEISDLLKKR